MELNYKNEDWIREHIHELSRDQIEETLIENVKYVNLKKYQLYM
jgi:hypothetical protein